MNPNDEFVPRESLRQTHDFHVAGICIEKTKKGIRLLIAERAGNRQLYPNLYEGCGGQLAPSETFEEEIRRHFRQEMNLDVRVLTDCHCFYTIREPELPVIPGIRFLCEQRDNGLPESPNHSEFKWVTERQFRSMKKSSFPPGLKEQVIALFKHYSSV